MFSSALASGQLGPLMNQFGLPSEAVDAANKGGEQCNILKSTQSDFEIYGKVSYSFTILKNFHSHKLSFAVSWYLDVEAFAKAMEGSDAKTDDGDSKDKKDDDEDMSLDQNDLLNTIVSLSLKCSSHASPRCLPVIIH